MKVEMIRRRRRRVPCKENVVVVKTDAFDEQVQPNVDRVDFALALAMVHEVPNPVALFKDIHRALRAGGKVLFAEPSGHVRAKVFEASLAQAAGVGFAVEPGPGIRRFHAAILKRS